MKNELNIIGHNIKKIDGLALACGADVFTDDIDLKNLLYAKILYSPYPHAIIKNIDVSEAEQIQGVHCILTYLNSPTESYSSSGQGYPEPSPYDCFILNRKMRFIGDRAAVVAADTEEIAEVALTKIKIEYEILPSILEPEKAVENSDKIIIHDEPEARVIVPVEYSPDKNIANKINVCFGKSAADFFEDTVVNNSAVYETQIVSHCMLEPHICITYLDMYGRIIIRTSTQTPFSVRRVVAQLLNIPVKSIRVVKPRVGGAFGAKQEIILEPVCALITLRTGRPVRFAYSRAEQFISSRTRHSQKIKLKTGADTNGNVKDLSMKILMNAGAYASHCYTVASNSGSKSLPMLNKIKNIEFDITSVYTNLPAGGAFRSYGAIQPLFALNTHLDEIAEKCGLDLPELILQQSIKTGEDSVLFKLLAEGKPEAETIVDACGLQRCIEKGQQTVDWHSKKKEYKEFNKQSSTKKRGIGMAVMMQGSSIPYIDMAAVTIKMNEDGSFNLQCGAADLGGGSDTVIAQIAAEVLACSVNDIIVYSGDTDLTPFDSGAYASSTTYLSGNAACKTAEAVKKMILNTGAEMLAEKKENLFLKNSTVISEKTGKAVSFKEIGYYTFYHNNQYQICATESYLAQKSPPPFSAQFAEIEIDIETCIIKIINYTAVTDCGRAINPKLAEGQVEGAIIMGLGFALTEEYRFDSKGKMLNPSLGSYKIFTSMDIPLLRNILIDNDEPSGPFGAKSIGEVAISGPAPAISNAVFNACGIRLRKTPFTVESIFSQIIH